MPDRGAADEAGVAAREARDRGGQRPPSRSRWRRTSLRYRRHILRRSDDEVRGTVESIGSPIKFVGSEMEDQAVVPRLREDGAAILRVVGYPDDDIDRLVPDRIVHLDVTDRAA